MSMRERPNAVLKLCQVYWTKKLTTILTPSWLWGDCHLTKFSCFVDKQAHNRKADTLVMRSAQGPSSREVDQPRTERSDSEPSLWIHKPHPSTPKVQGITQKREQEEPRIALPSALRSSSVAALHHVDPPHANPSPRLGQALQTHFPDLPFAFALYFW